jgi:hypothetical protein
MLLREALDSLRPVSIERIDAIVISADARVRVGRSNATLSPRAMDAWRRELSAGAASGKGDRRRRVGWTPVEEPVGRAPPAPSPVATSGRMASMIRDARQLADPASDRRALAASFHRLGVRWPDSTTRDQGGLRVRHVQGQPPASCRKGGRD